MNETPDNEGAADRPAAYPRRRDPHSRPVGIEEGAVHVLRVDDERNPTIEPVGATGGAGGVWWGLGHGVSRGAGRGPGKNPCPGPVAAPVPLTPRSRRVV